ncbi:MAG: hypothetical protein ACRCU2_32495 [Planktothrix sp.]
MTSLSDNQWKVAHAIAQQLVLKGADANELGKAIAYLRAFGDQPDAGKRFFTYLQTLANNGKMMAHSNQTPYYRKIISQICTQSLRPYQEDPAAMQEILGWGFRLMRYYKNAGPAGEQNSRPAPSPTPTKSPTLKRQPDIPKTSEDLNLKVGQQLPATVFEIKEKNKGRKITYEIPKTQQKLSNDEYSKQSSLLTEGQSVTVEVVSLKDDGSIKKVKLV